MAKLKPEWVKTDIPKNTKVKLWRIMKDNPTYRSWEEAIVGKSHTTAQDKLFANDELKYIKMSMDTRNALQYEIMHMPAEEMESLPADLQSWVKQLRPELEFEKYPRREIVATQMTSLSEKYLIDHYQKLHKVLEQFYGQLFIPKLSELCLFTLKSGTPISYSCVSEMDMPAIRYEEGTVKLNVEDSDPFLWECFRKHFTAEFPDFDTELSDWKKGIAAIVERCYSIGKIIGDQLTQKGWDSAKPYLSRDSKDYKPGVYYCVLTALIYECVIASYLPQFQRVSGELVMEYSTGGKAIARGDTSLLDQVEKCCLGIVSDDTIKEKAEHVLDLAKQAEDTLKPIRQNLRLVLERGTFKGTCSVCSDLVSQGG